MRRSSRTPTSPSSASSCRSRRTRRCSTAWSSSRCPTRSTTRKRRASTASSAPPPRRSAKCTSTRTRCMSPRCTRCCRVSVKPRSATPTTSKRCGSTPAKTSKASRRPKPTRCGDVEGVSATEADKMRQKNPDEGLAGVSPRFVINALSNAIIQSQAKSLTTMDVLIALKDAIESDVRIDGKKKRKWVDFLVVVRKDFYNRWVKEDVHKALFVSFEQEAQQLLDKYLDEVE